MTTTPRATPKTSTRSPNACAEGSDPARPSRSKNDRDSSRAESSTPGETNPSVAIDLLDRFTEIRRASESLAEPLSAEDQCIQSMDSTSPTKWHLAHTSWFFETFVLAQSIQESGEMYQPFHPAYAHLFNSYYQTVGTMHPRPQRGMLSRPGVADVMSYRTYVDDAICDALSTGRLDDDHDQMELLELGLHHEQQHQELILTDIKHAFSANPLYPAYRKARPLARPPRLESIRFVEQRVELGPGLVELGYEGEGFAFDNESPRHKVYLGPFAMGSRPVSCGEYLEFMEDDAYRRPELWLSDGWDAVQREGWTAPGYWERGGTNDNWRILTLHGSRDLYDDEPVTHVSFFEADAYARWAGHRLPSEAEWESVANDYDVTGSFITGNFITGNFVESGYLHPRAIEATPDAVGQLFGDVWEWTSSPYVAYPGYVAPEGAVGEYNGKFMCNQMVLRGGSCVTPRSHIRPTYRNFFQAETRWQFSGIRLAHSLD